MHTDDIVDWQQRWQLVEDREQALLRSTPIATKLEQLNTLMQSAVALGWRTHTEAEIETVRQRWKDLREIGCG